MDETTLRKLAGAAMTAYDLPVTAVAGTISVFNNGTFEVRDRADRYVLRVHRGGYRTPANTRSELRFLQGIHESLAAYDVDVPRPIPTVDGDLVVETTVDGVSRHCDLITWLGGAPRVPGKGLGPRATWQLGAALARLHNASAQWQPPDDVELPCWDANGMFSAGASPFRPQYELTDILREDDVELFHRIAERSAAVFDQLGAENFGIIHVDFILGNCLLRRTGRNWRVSVVDFDDSGFGCYLYDLCPLLGNLAGYPGAIFDNPGYPALRRAFLDGYRSARPLPAGWERYLPVLMAARHANHVFWTARPDVSTTHREDAAWRMDLARRCLDLN